MQVLDEPTLASLLGDRTRTDTNIPGVWMSATAGSYIAWSAIAVLVMLGVSRVVSISLVPIGLLALLDFFLSAASAYLVYVLVNRRNTHLARAEAALWRVFDAVRSKARQDDLQAQLVLSSAERNLAALSQGSREKSAVLWGLLTMIPYAGWVALIIVLAFLSSDLKRHEMREEAVILDLDRVLRAGAGIGLPTMQWKSHYRNTIAFILLSFVTLGILALFWLFLAMEDPGTHFQYHQHLEETLVKAPPDAGTFVAGAA